MWALGVILFVLLSGRHPFSTGGTGAGGWGTEKRVKMVRAGARRCVAGSQAHVPWCGAGVLPICEHTVRGCERASQGMPSVVPVWYSALLTHSVCVCACVCCVQDIIKQCLAQDREERITIDGILKHPWIVTAQSTQPLPGVAHMKQFLNRHKFEHALVHAAARQALNHDRDMTLLATAHGFEADDLVRIQAAFVANSPDDGSCRVSVDDFEAIMRTLGYGDMPWRRMHDLFDEDGSGLVDYREFLAGLSKLNTPTEGNLELLFKIYDAHNDGGITREEFAYVGVGLCMRGVRVPNGCDV